MRVRGQGREWQRGRGGEGGSGRAGGERASALAYMSPTDPIPQRPLIAWRVAAKLRREARTLVAARSYGAEHAACDMGHGTLLHHLCTPLMYTTS